MTNNNNKVRNIFEGETEKKTDSVLTGTKVTTAVSLIGVLASGGVFGYSFYQQDSTKMVIFGVLMLICAGFFLGNVIKMKKK